MYEGKEGLDLGVVRSVIFWAFFATLSCFQVSAQGGKGAVKSTIDVVQDDEAFDALHKQYLAEGNLQFERPVFKAEPEEETETRPPSEFKLPQWLISFFKNSRLKSHRL